MNEQLKNQIVKLKEQREKAETLAEIQEIDWKIDMCLFRLGELDYDVKSRKFVKIKK